MKKTFNYRNSKLILSVLLRHEMTVKLHQILETFDLRKAIN